MGRVRDGWGRVPFKLKQQSRRSRRGLPILRDHFARVGHRSGGNTWRGSCGVKLFGGAYGVRKPLSGAFASASPEEQRERILGPFNLINRTYYQLCREDTLGVLPTNRIYNTTVEEAKALLPHVGAFPNFYRIYVLLNMEPLTSELLDEFTESCTDICQKRTDTTIVLTSAVHASIHRVLRPPIQASAEAGNLCDRITDTTRSGITLLTLLEECIQELTVHHPHYVPPLCVMNDTTVNVRSTHAPTKKIPSFREIVRWYILKNDPRKPAVHRNLFSNSVVNPRTASGPERERVLGFKPQYISPVNSSRHPGMLCLLTMRPLQPKIQHVLTKKMYFQRIRDVWVDLEAINTGPQKELDSFSRIPI